MLVTHVITRLIVGGAQENTAATVLGLQGKPGFRTNLVTGPSSRVEGNLENWFDPFPGVLIKCENLIRPVRPIPDIKALFELRRIFREQKPVLVHTHSGKAGIAGRWAARLEKVPIIVHSIHGPSFGPWQRALPNLVYTRAEKAVAPMTTRFIAVAQAMIDQYLAAGISTPDKYTRIFSGFPLEPFLNAKNDPAVRKRFGLAPDDIVIGKIARMTELKGHDDLFAIAHPLLKERPRVKFLLIGGGPWEGRFKEKARGLGLENQIVFAGLVPPVQIPELTGILDVLVHLSRREGLPRAVSQSLAAGKPVIAYDCDGAGEVCLDGKTGFLVPAGDHALLLERLKTLCDSAELRARLGTAGRELVKANFSVEGMVDAIYELYLKLFQEAGVRVETRGR